MQDSLAEAEAAVMEAEAVGGGRRSSSNSNSTAPLSPGASADEDIKALVAAVDKARRAAQNASQVCFDRIPSCFDRIPSLLLSFLSSFSWLFLSCFFHRKDSRWIRTRSGCVGMEFFSFSLGSFFFVGLGCWGDQGYTAELSCVRLSASYGVPFWFGRFSISPRLLRKKRNMHF